MVHGSTIRDPEIVDDLDLSCFNIEFDFDKACGEGRYHAPLAHIISCHTDQAGIHQAGDRTGSHGIDIIRYAMSTVCSTEFDRFLSRSGVRHASGGV